MVRLGNTDIVRDATAIDPNPDKPRRSRAKKHAASTSDSDWRDGWYPPSSINADDLDSTYNNITSSSTSSSSPSIINTISLQNNCPLAAAEKDNTIKMEPKVDTVSQPKNKNREADTTSEKVYANKQQQPQVPKSSEDANKSKKIFDKIKNLFKF